MAPMYRGMKHANHRWRSYIERRKCSLHRPYTWNAATIAARSASLLGHPIPRCCIAAPTYLRTLTPCAANQSPFDSAIPGSSPHLQYRPGPVPRLRLRTSCSAPPLATAAPPCAPSPLSQSIHRTRGLTPTLDRKAPWSGAHLATPSGRPRRRAACILVGTVAVSSKSSNLGISAPASPHRRQFRIAAPTWARITAIRHGFRPSLATRAHPSSASLFAIRQRLGSPPFHPVPPCSRTGHLRKSRNPLSVQDLIPSSAPVLGSIK